MTQQGQEAYRLWDEYQGLLAAARQARKEVAYLSDPAQWGPRERFNGEEMARQVGLAQAAQQAADAIEPAVVVAWDRYCEGGPEHAAKRR